MNRELVGKVYLLLKHAEEMDGCLNMTLSQLTAAYQNRYQREISALFMDTILKVLTELNLVKVEKELLQAHIYLQPAPKEKLDLMQSPTFARALMDS